MKPALAFLMIASAVFAQSPQTFPLWSEAAPGALGTAEKDVPTLTIYRPDSAKANGAAMVICPGGGYGHLANHEGEHYARFLNESGITGFVVKYRLGPAGYRHPAMMNDASRAVRLVRARAAEWNLDPKRIGIMGSSAGGHLASTVLTHFDAGKMDSTDPIERVSSRPDLGILCYPVISLGEFGHKGSWENLLGKDPDPALVKLLSNELQVTDKTPPCFLWHTYDDSVVPVENSTMFADALRKAGVPYELHVYVRGRHGLGLGTGNWDPSQRHPWTINLVFWLKTQGFIR